MEDSHASLVDAPSAPGEAVPARGATHALGEELASMLGSPLAPGRLHRVEIPLEPLDPLAWLGAQKQTTQYYWGSRDGAWCMAGTGEASVLAPLGSTDLDALFRQMRTQLSEEYGALRYYGGFRFRSGPVKGERWHAFKEYRFVVPRFEVVRRGRRCAFACNFKISANTDVDKLLKQLLGELEELTFDFESELLPLPPPTQRVDLPNKNQWRDLVHNAIKSISDNFLQKVVLARESTYKFEVPLDPVAVLRRLLPLSPQCFEFCFHPADDRAFIGCSPERLFRRANVYLESEAVAGTRARGATDAEDAQLAEALQCSEKEIREHRLVVRRLHEVFDRFCRHIHIDDGPSLMRLRNVQHLYTHVHGILDEEENDAALVEAFHPTPAVGGTPGDRALQFIAEKEPFDRGIYAGPVGWVGYDSAEFCVAIRSALVQGSEISVYTGAGIVAGSIASEEWDELEAKIRNFLEVLGA